MNFSINNETQTAHLTVPLAEAFEKVLGNTPYNPAKIYCGMSVNCWFIDPFTGELRASSRWMDKHTTSFLLGLSMAAMPPSSCPAAADVIARLMAHLEAQAIYEPETLPPVIRSWLEDAQKQMEKA